MRSKIIAKREQIPNFRMSGRTCVNLVRSLTRSFLAEVEAPDRTGDLCIEAFATYRVSELLHPRAEPADIGRRIQHDENIDYRLRREASDRRAADVLDCHGSNAEHVTNPARLRDEVRRPL